MDYAVLFHISAGILLYTSLHSLAGEEPTCFRNNSHHGSYSEWCLIFSQGLQIWKGIALGEVDLGEPLFQFMCFITTLNDDEMKWEEAIKQTKGMGLVNTAVSSMRANRNEVIAWMLDFQTIKQEFGDLRKYCSNARFVYMTKSFVDKIITDENIVNTKLLTTAIESLPTRNSSAYPLCKDARYSWELGCICTWRVCTEVVPCNGCKSEALHGSDCDIKSCTKCTVFEFYVAKNSDCFWARFKELNSNH